MRIKITSIEAEVEGPYMDDNPHDMNAILGWHIYYDTEGRHNYLFHNQSHLNLDYLIFLIRKQIKDDQKP